MTKEKRLTWRQVKLITKTLVEKQKGICDICGYTFNDRDGIVLDHCHETGLIRGAIHRSCNGAEGKIRIKANWCHKRINKTDFIIALGKYLEKYKENPRNFLHPNHLNKEEKLIMNLVRKKSRAKSNRV